LHNAAGIVGIRVDSVKHNHASDGSSKRIQVEDSMGRSVPILVPFFKTGETPKVITSDAREKKLLVSNWHSNTISVLDLLPEHPYAKPFKDIRMPAIPRGMVSDPTRKKTYVAIMGGTSLAVIDESNWSMDTILPISGAPRHRDVYLSPSTHRLNWHVWIPPPVKHASA
jgi:DNA-binding beta-propeller fold protein YncE